MKTFYLFCRGLALVVAVIWHQSAMARTRDAQNAAYLEMAPLKGVYGQLSARAEFPVWYKFSWGLTAESIAEEGLPEASPDTTTTLGLESLYYPVTSEYGKIFVGAGLAWQQTQADRRELRDTRTWARSQGDDRFLTWEDHGDYLCTTQMIGARIDRGGWFTSSVRLMMDQVIQKSVVAKDINWADEAEAIEPQSRKSSETKVMMHIGFAIP